MVRFNHWENEEYEASKGKKGKGKRSKSKGKSKGKSTPRSITPRPSQTPRTEKPQPKYKPEARSRMADGFLFAMMSTKSKPSMHGDMRHGIQQTTWFAQSSNRRSKKLPVVKPGKWSIAPRSRVALYGHDAKSMKNFTLHFDNDNQCDSLDRLWLGEM